METESAEKEKGNELVLTPEMERKLTGVRFYFPRSMDGRLAGVHHSPQSGASVEFSDHKEYSPGDDIRHVNWKAFGRCDKFYVRQFAKDTHASVYFVLDASLSMQYRSDFAPESKAVFAARLALALSHVFLHQNDAVGLLVVRGRKLTDFVPARSHGSHLLNLRARLRNTMVEVREHPEHHEGLTSLREGLEFLISYRVARAAVVIISDFLIELDELFSYLAYLKGAGNFVWLIQLLDPAEYDMSSPGSDRTFPFEGAVLFKSRETAASVSMDTLLARPHFMARLRSFLDTLENKCAEIGIELRRCNTDMDLVEFLLKHLLERR